MKGIIKIAFLVLMVSVHAAIIAQDPDNQTLRIRIAIDSVSTLHNIPVAFEREDIREKYVDVSIPASQLSTLKSQIPGLKMLPAEPALDDSDMAVDLNEALTFTKYPTYEQYEKMMQYFALNYPEICRLDTFGYSNQGRLLLALKISDNVFLEEDEPSFLYTATIHGDELVGYMLTLRLADFLLSNYGKNIEVDRIINDVEIWINPLSNPDGTFYPDNNMSVAGAIRRNVNGYDLNRHFPDPKSHEADDTTGRQIENKYMMQFLRKHRFNLSANLHAGAEVVNYPWDHTYNLHPDDDWFQYISREYADVATADDPTYMNDFTNGITNGAEWYVIYGGRQDYVTYYLQGRELTLELSNTKKIPCELLEKYWNLNQWSLINHINQSRFGIHGKVFSSNTGLPVDAKIWVAQHDDSTSWVSSDPVYGSFYRYLKKGIYDLIASAEGYFNDTIRNVEVFDYEKTVLTFQMDSTAQIDSTAESDGFNEPDLNFRVYPNPVSENIHIDFINTQSTPINYTIYSITGNLVMQGVLQHTQLRHQINLSSLPEGIYLLQLRTEDGKQFSIRIAKP